MLEVVIINEPNGDTNYRKALEYALKLLAYRARTTAGIKKKMADKGFPSATIELVLNKLQAEGYLDDGQFVRNWIESRLAAKPMGRRRMVFELQQKGVAKETIIRALEGYSKNQDEMELATKLAEQRWQSSDNLSPEKAWQRLASFLERRGFSWDTIEAVRRRLIEETQAQNQLRQEETTIT